MITYIDAIIESPLTEEQAAELAEVIAQALADANVSGSVDVSQAYAN